MLKIFKKYFVHEKTKAALVAALAYYLLHNSAVLIYKFSYCGHATFKVFFEISKDFLVTYGATCLIFFGLTISHIVFIFGSILLFVSGALCSYYLFLFKITPSRYIIRAAFDSDTTELLEIIGPNLVKWVIFSLLIIILIIKCLKIYKWQKPSPCSLISSSMCLLCSILFIISPPYTILKYYFPIQYLHNSYQYFVDKSDLNLRFDISREFNFTDKSDNDIVGVLVIGETARFDHFGIYGYHRQTTPHLSKTSNLSYFKASSSANLTYISIPSLLSRYPASRLNEVWKETGLLSILTTMGFTTSWIGTQSLRKYYNNLYNPYEEVLTSIIPGGSLLILPHSYDEVMLPYITAMLDKVQQKKFIVVHTMGSHWAYEKRYPKEFARFIPECISSGNNDHRSCDLDNLINSYDNSILYTDFFIYQIIELLKNKNAFLIYISDHGESLGENGYYGHGGENAPHEQFAIPLIIWHSEIFRQRHQDLVLAIKSHEKNKYISHDNIFHSVLDCLGVRSQIIDKDLSLCKTR